MMHFFRISVTVATLALLSTTAAGEDASEPRVASQPTHPQQNVSDGQETQARVCYHAGDRNGFETCTEIILSDCVRYANGTLICETRP